MDKLIIKDLEVFAYHGVFPEEKALGQKFLISLTLKFDMQEAAITGDLTKSVHYGELCHALETEFKKESYDLIETAGEMLSTYVLNHYPMVTSVSILIKKPWAPILKSLDTVAIEINRCWHTVFIGLGSNMGDRKKNLLAAAHAVEKTDGVEMLIQSSIIETEPWGNEDQEAFLNCVLKIKTTLPPHILMSKLLEIENSLLRERTIHWGPRTIDCDILFYDDWVSDDPHIVLPHPLVHERPFVLESMVEIAPYFLHPILKKRMIELFPKV